MSKYVSVAEMIAVEKAADAAGHSYAAMMQAAGRGLADRIEAFYGDLSDRTAFATVGSGNNGGDALVALTHLEDWGWETAAVLLKERNQDPELSRKYLEDGGEILDGTQPADLRRILQEQLTRCSVLVDGILGTGIQLPIRGSLQELMEILQAAVQEHAGQIQIVAVDCPSGMDCDSGEVSPVCLAADLTVTMAAVKQGLLKFPAADYTGDISLVGIDLPQDLPAFSNISREAVDYQLVQQILPIRKMNSHKGTYGTVLLAAGSENYPGAALLAAGGAYQVGGGLVQAAVPDCIYTGVIGSLAEATWIRLRDHRGGITGEAAAQISRHLERPGCLLIGPGLGTRPGTADFIQEVFQLDHLPPAVVDADGLRLLSRIDQWWDLLPDDSVLTPHPGEMALMTGLSVQEIQQDRVSTAERFAAQWDCCLVLKGAFSVAADPDGSTAVVPVASSALASAGTGDVLSGMIAGLLVQGVPPFEAAAAGSWIHAQAGLQAAAVLGTEASVTAGDVSEAAADILAWLDR